MFFKLSNRTIQPLKSSVLHVELNDNEQEKISGGATNASLAGEYIDKEPFLAIVTSPKDTSR